MRPRSYRPMWARRSGRPPWPRRTGRCSAPSAAGPVRTYVGVGVNTQRHGRDGFRVARAVPLAPPPPPPPSPTITYDEKGRSPSTWPPVGSAPPAPREASPDGAGADRRTIGPLPPALGYNVYDTTTGAPADADAGRRTRLHRQRGSSGARSAATRVRAVGSSDGADVESDARRARVHQAGRHVSAGAAERSEGRRRPRARSASSGSRTARAISPGT